MADFSKRSNLPEIMDDLNCHGEVVDQTLREIAFINKTLGGNELTLSGLQLLLDNKNGKFSIADLGCGGGEMLEYIDNWGKKKGFQFRLTGVDANPNIVAFAEKNMHRFNFICDDVLSDSFNQQQFDILTCTLFTHHFSSDTLTQLLRSWIKQVRIGIIINDLHRHPMAYYSIKLLTKFFSNSDMVKYDAPLSVLRGFTRKEWKEILFSAGIQKYQLTWRWAFRWQLIIFK